MDIVIKNLNKSFGDKHVLRDFSAVFPNGGLSCLMGRSGCGKTTLLNILLGLIKADSGSVEGMPELVSCVFQEDRLCDDFSAYTNVRMVCKGKTKRNDIVRDLAELGLVEDAYKRVSELSGGMRRRVAIARAFAVQSDMVIMDEPLKGLDEKTKLITAEYIKKRLVGRSAIMVTHDESEVALMGGELILMPSVADKENGNEIQ